MVNKLLVLQNGIGTNHS